MAPAVVAWAQALAPALLLSWPIPLPEGWRMAEVSLARGGRVYFQEEPRPCPLQGACTWRRRGYLVDGDRVGEERVQGAFSFVTHVRYEALAVPAHEEVRRTSGWVPSQALCLHPPLRKSRSEPLPPLGAPGRKACPRAFTRTVAGDEAFYLGQFRSPATALTVTEVGAGELGFRLQIDAGACQVEFAGAAYAHRPSVFNGDSSLPCQLNMTFDDGGVALRVTGCSDPACPDRSEDLAWQPPPAPASRP